MFHFSNSGHRSAMGSRAHPRPLPHPAHRAPARPARRQHPRPPLGCDSGCAARGRGGGWWGPGVGSGTGLWSIMDRDGPDRVGPIGSIAVASQSVLTGPQSQLTDSSD